MTIPIHQLIAQPEGKTLEFKRDLSSPKNLPKTPAAFRSSADSTALGPKIRMGREDTRGKCLLPEPKMKGIGVRPRFTVYLAEPISVPAQVVTFCQEAKSAKEIMAHLGLKQWKTFQSNDLLPLLRPGIVERTIPEKPQSSRQRPRLAEKGRQRVEERGKRPIS